MAKVEYPTWKIVAWRYGRVFLAAFIASISVDQLVLGTQDLTTTLARSAVAAGLAAMAKLLREESTRFEKLPV